MSKGNKDGSLEEKMKRIIKVLFSRYFIAGLIIFAELGFVFYLLLFAYNYSAYALLLMVLINLSAVVSIVNRDVNPEYKIPWLIIVLLVPIFGIAIYFILSSRSESHSKKERMRAATERILGESDKDSELRSSEALSAISECDPMAYGRVRGILRDDPLAAAYGGSSSEYYPLGERMHEAMLKDIAGAKRYIFLEYFIIYEGVMWQELFSLIKEKAKEGVEVKILYDDIGCIGTLPRRFVRTLEDSGISVVPFSPLTARLSPTHNNRDHRKLVVIDGRVAYTGGVNIADEYINKKRPLGHWKDGGVRIFGDAVDGFVKMFLSLWQVSGGEFSSVSHYIWQGERDFAGDGGFYIPFASGPFPIYERSSAKNALINVINQAKRSVLITTPYLVIDYDLTEALCNASFRGAKVKIITPRVADKRFVKIMTKSAYPHLIEAGVEIYEYQPGFIHEKNTVVDGESAIVGTINLAYRSLVHNYEDAVMIYSSPTVKEIEEEFEKTLSVSVRMEKRDVKLNYFERLIRNALRIFAPLL